MRWLAFLLLSGCSLSYGLWEKPVSTKDIRIINREACPSLIEVKSYLSSQGISLKESDTANKTLVCLSTPPRVLRWLSPMYFAGISDGNVVWAMDDAKVILHELGHLLWQLPHQALGLMTPVNDLTILATGFTDNNLTKMRNL